MIRSWASHLLFTLPTYSWEQTFLTFFIVFGILTGSLNGGGGNRDLLRVPWVATFSPSYLRGGPNQICVAIDALILMLDVHHSSLSRGVLLGK